MESTRGYAKAEDSICSENYRDNWFRTFRGMPEFSEEENKMLKSFVIDNEYTKMVIYLTNPIFGYEFDADMAEFIVREFIRNV